MKLTDITIPGGSDGSVQYNDNYLFGGDSSFTYDDLTNELYVAGAVLSAAIGTTGWPLSPGVTLSFDDGTLTLTVTDGGSAYYYIQGVKYTLGGNKTVTITDTEGLWFIYFSGSTLTASQTPWVITDDDKALVAFLYWDATNNKSIFLGYELHGYVMDAATHARLHHGGGAAWEEGFTPTDTGSETLNIAAGEFHDEDIEIAVTDGAGGGLFEQVLSPAEMPIYYRSGASAWRIYETADKGNADDLGYVDGSNDLHYNKLNGTWASTAVSGVGKYVAYWVLATNEQTEPVILVMGQNEDNTLALAKDNNTWGGMSIDGLPFQEVVLVARVILKSTAAGLYYTLEEIVDLRGTNAEGNVTSTLAADHGALGGLTDDDHSIYALLAGRTGGQTLYGSDTTAEDLTLADNSVDGNTITVTQAIAAYTHANGSDGTDHTFIDQDVTTTGTPTFTSVTLSSATWQIVDRLNLDDTNYNVFLGTDVFDGAAGVKNVGIGYQAGYLNSVTGGASYGDQNVYIGYLAGYGTTANTGYSNVAIGSRALWRNTSGAALVALGVNAGYSNTTGIHNFYLGTQTGFYNQTGGYNVCIGSDAGYGVSGNSFNSNIFMGYQSGHDATTALANIGIGRESLYSVGSATGNICIGRETGRYITLSGNTIIGHLAGDALTAVYSNVMIGGYAGSNATSAVQNTVLGYEAARLLTTGDDNVFLGHRAGYRQTTNSNLLIIDNRDRTSDALELANSLVYGVFAAASANQSLRVNGYLISKEAIKILERSSDPSQPAEGECVIWLSDGTGYGDDGDICVASQAGGVTNKAIIFDHSAGDAW